MSRPLAASLLCLASLSLFALEGKWTPQQVLQLDAAWLRKQGLELPPARLWDPKRGTGLLAAAIQVGGCSAGFISPDGLFITNHHCLFGILQEHATPQNDIITNGFIANARDAELRGTGVKVTIPRRFTDVTREVLAAVPATATDAERNAAIEKKSNELVAACEKQPGARCKVSAFDGGVQYVLVDGLELGDVRLVYAPPRAIGEYGGEIDNFAWPRHTGDFSIGRAYVDGKPYKSEHYFPLSTKGVVPGDFVMLLGYPGITYRSLTAAEMTERRDLFFTRRVDLYGEWIGILEDASKTSPAAEITLADNLKNLANRYKNAQGQLAGFKRGHIVEKQQAADDAVLKTAPKSAADAYRGLNAMVDEQRKTWERDFLLSQIAGTNASPTPVGPKSLFFATTVARSAIERAKPDADRDPLYMNRNLPRVRERMEREQKNYVEAADKRMTASVFRRLSMPPNVDDLYANSKIFDLGERMKMLDESVGQLRARHDPLVDLGFALDRDLRDLGDRRARWDGTISRLRPEWRKAVYAHAGKPVAPDANSTLRVTFAHVKGYKPHDAVWYDPQTTLSGVVEKDTGEEPFHAPTKLLDAAREKRLGSWKDAKLKDVPVDFLADADTTGGNSGSPTVNGRGELVGVNFDRVFENVANDFGYNPDVARNVNVDIRYLLWLLDQVEHAQGLLHELGVR